MTSKNTIMVRVGINKKNFQAFCQDAVKAGIRSGKHQAFKLNPKSFTGEQVANVKELAKFLKFCYAYWQEAEPKRLQEQAEALKQLQQAQEKAKKVGIV